MLGGGGKGRGGDVEVYSNDRKMASSPFLFCPTERDKIIRKVNGINMPKGEDTFQDLLYA